ncbi:forkhead box protein B2-like [Anopheles cruzii]|uniref:forkhead box protein B2-like n=1 Tax=Anopheles cruzii TaxID=68878 RepID=UPI0022EC88CE|nr:forkhead box protein B2-like [Anopheles cruzii]XP_052870820.1 forkhead box protein B2-like [Anopheles cruzii]
MATLMASSSSISGMFDNGYQRRSSSRGQGPAGRGHSRGEHHHHHSHHHRYTGHHHHRHYCQTHYYHHRSRTVGQSGGQRSGSRVQHVAVDGRPTAAEAAPGPGPTAANPAVIIANPPRPPAAVATFTTLGTAAGNSGGGGGGRRCTFAPVGSDTTMPHRAASRSHQQLRRQQTSFELLEQRRYRLERTLGSPPPANPTVARHRSFAD